MWRMTVVSALLFVGSLALGQEPRPPGAVRFATFNASLNRDTQGALARDLSTPDNTQARNVAEIIQRVAPDVLLINEFDYDAEGRAAALFQENYLARSQNGAPALTYAYRYTSEVNTGVPSGHDLDGDGKVVKEPGSRGYGNDAFGFGQFPGQYGMVVYSKYPIDKDTVRRFTNFLWKDMPAALLPTRPGGKSWYSPEALAVFRLSSKSHWDLPIQVEGRPVHLLVSHPTPPAFDGPEDRNGKRNHDEIRLWADYLRNDGSSKYLGESPGVGGLNPPETFVLMGDLNADPLDGGSVPGAIDQLLKHPKINASIIPRSPGAAEAARLQGKMNAKHQGAAENDTADFADESVGNLRVDYVLPSMDLKVLDGGVFWPAESDPLSRLVRMRPVASSDHRLVYLDIQVSPAK